MGQSDLLEHLTRTFETLGIPYLITGSMATIAYGEPRFTNDIDVVARISAQQISAVCAAFPEPDYYCSFQAVEQAVRHSSQFNILHPGSGLKIDVMLATDSAFDRSRLSRGIRLPAGPNFEVTFAAPEDVILKKLEYYRLGGSEKHLRDILGVLKIQSSRIDQGYLVKWVAWLGLQAEWRLIEERRDA
jgi:hypothetical protein